LHLAQVQVLAWIGGLSFGFEKAIRHTARLMYRLKSKWYNADASHPDRF